MRITLFVSVLLLCLPALVFGTPFYEWDPNDYSTTQQLIAANTNPGVDIISLATNQVLYDGSIGNVMRQTYPGDGSEGHANYDLLLPGAGDGVTDEIWIEFYMRFDENWNYATDDKTFFVMPNTQLGRWELHYGAWGTRVYGGPSTSPNDYFIVSDDDRIDVATDVWGGEWHRTRLYLRMSSTTGASDGAFYWWIDDTPLITDTVAALYGAGDGEGIPTGNSAGQYFGSFRLSANADPEPSGIRDWGPLRVWTEDPEWTFGGEPQPDCANGATRSCGSDVGACVAGTQTCSSGSWGSCVGAIGPSSEVCDGLDNDCDGVVDEGGVCPVDPDPVYPVVSVSSSYEGYSSDVIDDGIIDAYGGPASTWASADTGGPHWIEFDFGEEESLSEFTIYWGYNTASSSYMTSQEILVQAWDGTWQTVGTFARSADEASSPIAFAPHTAQRWRVYQPANRGPVPYDSVLWLTEIDYVLGAGNGLVGDVDGSGVVDVDDLLIIIGNFRRSQFDAWADVNGDGVVNVFDLVLVARDFGRSVSLEEPPQLLLGSIDDLSVSAGDGQASLSWTAAENALSHQPSYKLSSSSTWNTYGSLLGSGASSVLVSGLTNGVSYDFRISAHNASDAVMSNVVSATPQAHPQSESLAWFSDWRTATGDSNNAFFDGGKWNGGFLTVDTELGSIIPAAGLGFPAEMTNVFRYEIPNDNRGLQIRVEDAWTLPAVGEYQYYRYYIRSDFPPGHSPNDQHFFHLGRHAGQSYESTFWLNGVESAGGGVSSSGAYRVQFIPNWQSSYNNEYAWHNLFLQTQQVYRIELRVHRVAATELRYSIRVYDSAGNLRASSPDEMYFEYYGSRGWSGLEEFIALVGNAASVLQAIELGYNGSGPTGTFSPTPYVHIGGVAVRVSASSDDWIGAYPVAGVES